MVRTETYRDLCHGTYKEAAEKIVTEGFKPSKEKNSWCGSVCDGSVLQNIRQGGDAK